MADDDLTGRIARRLRERREAWGWSLDELAARSAVSRSNISLIERGESNATAVVLDKLASALDVTLSALVEPDGTTDPSVARRADQPVWTDPSSGYRRRAVTPPGAPGGVSLVEIEFPAGASVAFDHVGRGTTLHQQVWVLTGTIEVTVGGTTTTLARGDCHAFDVDRPVSFRNPGRAPARYALVQHVDAAGRRHR